MDNNLFRYTMRIDKDLYLKLRYIAEYSGRSVNKEIEQMIKRRVQKFEKEVEKIPIGNLDKSDDDT